MTISALNVMKAEVLQSKTLLEILQDGIDLDDDSELTKKKSHGHFYYYRRKRIRRRDVLKYLGKATSDAVKDFVSRRYRRELAKMLAKKIEVLERCIDDYTEITPEDVYAKMPEIYGDFKREHFIDERLEEIKRWANEDYPKNPREFPKNYSVTIDGTKVRSKGECIWYNILYIAGIPFRYDCELTFFDENGMEVKKCPDFLIWCYDGSFVIIEHLGMLKSMKYAVDFGEKLHLYIMANFIPGYNLVITSDNKDGGTDSTHFLLAVEHVKRLFYRM